MPRKDIINPLTALSHVESFQTQLGLVTAIVDCGAISHLLTASEVGRQAGLPGKWGMKGYHCNLLAEAAGLIVKDRNKWIPADGFTSHFKKIGGALRWFPSAIESIRVASRKYDLNALKAKVQP